MSNKINLKTINKGKMKNYFKSKRLLTKKGVATAEMVLIIAVLLVIIITVFYPQIKSILSTTFTTLSTWYNKALSNLGMF